MKKIFNYLLIGAMAFNLGTASAGENTKKEDIKSKKAQTAVKAEEIADDIVADEINENNLEQPLIPEKNGVKNQNSKLDKAGTAAKNDTSESESKKNLYFSMSTKDRLTELKEKRMQEYYFHEKLSNDYFKIYEDEDNYVIHCKLPFPEKDCDINAEFKDENNLVINFKDKAKKDEKPVRYEIKLPKATTKKIFQIMVDGRLEITAPIDFFMVERMERHKGTK